MVLSEDMSAITSNKPPGIQSSSLNTPIDRSIHFFSDVLPFLYLTVDKAIDTCSEARKLKGHIADGMVHGKNRDKKIIIDLVQCSVSAANFFNIIFSHRKTLIFTSTYEIAEILFTFIPHLYNREYKKSALQSLSLCRSIIELKSIISPTPEIAILCFTAKIASKIFAIFVFTVQYYKSTRQVEGVIEEVVDFDNKERPECSMPESEKIIRSSSEQSSGA